MRVKVSCLLIGFMLMAQVTSAANRPLRGEPPLDMLEFLGTWPTVDSADLDPFELNDTDGMPFADFRPQKEPADSGKEATSQDRTGRKPSPRQDRLPEGVDR